jgi:hypothetical protein
MRRWFKDRANAQVDALLTAVILAVAVRSSTIGFLIAAFVLSVAATAEVIKKNPSPHAEYSVLNDWVSGSEPDMGS